MVSLVSVEPCKEMREGKQLLVLLLYLMKRTKKKMCLIVWARPLSKVSETHAPPQTNKYFRDQLKKQVNWEAKNLEDRHGVNQNNSVSQNSVI